MFLHLIFPYNHRVFRNNIKPLANLWLLLNFLLDILNGNLTLTQNGTERTTTYISSAQPLLQTIAINAGDWDFLKRNATYFETYWFVDCEYVNKTDGLTIQHRFQNENATHNLEALM